MAYVFMIKNILLLLAAAVPLFTMGAGCVAQDTNNQRSSGHDTWSSTSVSAIPAPGNANGNDESGLSVIIEPGAEADKIKNGGGEVHVEVQD